MPRIDWPQLLGDMAHLFGEPGPGNPDARTPCSTAKLSTHLDVPRTTLIGWMDGNEPKHMDGERLLLRWCTLTGKPREFAPLERRGLSAAQMR